MISTVSPSFLKQTARQLRKVKPLTQSQALDEAARQFGFSNYRNYLNALESNRNQSNPSIEILLKNISSETDMFKKMDIAISHLQNFKAPFHEQLNILKLFQHSKDTQFIYEKLKSEPLDIIDQPFVQYICEKLNFMKDEIQSYLLKDANSDEGKGALHDIHHDIFDPDHFIAKEVSVNNLIYGIDEDRLRISEGDYITQYKFDFENILVEEEYPKEDFSSEYFNDRKMRGTFWS